MCGKCQTAGCEVLWKEDREWPEVMMPFVKELEVTLGDKKHID